MFANVIKEGFRGIVSHVCHQFNRWTSVSAWRSINFTNLIFLETMDTTLNGLTSIGCIYESCPLVVKALSHL
jgi:hypothetical protein